MRPLELDRGSTCGFERSIIIFLLHVMGVNEMIALTSSYELQPVRETNYTNCCVHNIAPFFAWKIDE